MPGDTCSLDPLRANVVSSLNGQHPQVRICPREVLRHHTPSNPTTHIHHMFLLVVHTLIPNQSVQHQISTCCANIAFQYAFRGLGGGNPPRRWGETPTQEGRETPQKGRETPRRGEESHPGGGETPPRREGKPHPGGKGNKTQEGAPPRRERETHPGGERKPMEL